MAEPLADGLDGDPGGEGEAGAGVARWEFMLVVAPLRLAAGTGSPVNPIAIF